MIETAAEPGAIIGVGTDVPSALLVAAGDNPERLKTEATFVSEVTVTDGEQSARVIAFSDVEGDQAGDQVEYWPAV